MLPVQTNSTRKGPTSSNGALYAGVRHNHSTPFMLQPSGPHGSNG